ncbi:MAG: hypothetical protein A2W35_06520 [Chloroflexi bacterium RBG_16_57_11]|nr:MAG: hypothetical protein A2W35_06520 [Chloroflexi bacterium RBG_16_57_11]
MLFFQSKHGTPNQVLYLPSIRATVVLVSATTLVWAQTTSSPIPGDGLNLYYLIGTGLLGAVGALAAGVKILFSEIKALNATLLTQAANHDKETWARVIPLLDANRNICARLDLLTEAVERIVPGSSRKSTK